MCLVNNNVLSPTSQRSVVTCSQADSRCKASMSCCLSPSASSSSQTSGSGVQSSLLGSYPDQPSHPNVSATIPGHQDMDMSADLPSCLAVASVIIPTLQHIPKVARTAWAGLLADVFIAISSRPTDLQAWTKLLMLAKCILVSPSQRGHCGRSPQRLLRIGSGCGRLEIL